MGIVLSLLPDQGLPKVCIVYELGYNLPGSSYRQNSCDSRWVVSLLRVESDISISSISHRFTLQCHIHNICPKCPRHKACNPQAITVCILVAVRHSE